MLLEISTDSPSNSKEKGVKSDLVKRYNSLATKKAGGKASHREYLPVTLSV